MSSFDSLASSYDDIFTHGSIGRMQRTIVHDYLHDAIDWPLEDLLEIGCGTGEDLLYFESKAKYIDAFDLSPEMTRMARAKIKGNPSAIQIFQKDLKIWISEPHPKQYDLIFSNFGVLNCLDPSYFPDFHAQCSKVVSAGGSLVLVVMPRHCLFEKLYFLWKGKWSEINRRSAQSENRVLLKGSIQPTWYHDPNFIRRIFTDFRTEKLLPVGLTIPPSYLQYFFNRKPLWLNKLHDLDKSLRKMNQLSRFADHFLIHLVKK